MTFGIGYRDSARTRKIKLLYLLPAFAIAFPFVLITHGVVGCVQVVSEFPKSLRNVLYGIRERERQEAMGHK